MITIYQSREIRNLRVIQKKNQDAQTCHHLQIELITGQENPDFFSISHVIAKRMSMLSESNYLTLELSIKRELDRNYCCTQCGEKFSRQEYKFYKFLFAHAKICHYDVWKLKKLYRDRDKGMKIYLKMYLVPGRQKYVCKVSRMVAACIIESSNKEELYDEWIEKFR